MGRGLSELQKWILRKAGTLKRVHYADVLEGYFGFKPEQEIARHGVGRYANDPRAAKCGYGTIFSPGQQHFAPEKIGRQRYRSAMASLSRACSRLHARGLVDCISGQFTHWSGVEITDAGRQWLSVNLVS